jgi:hypothetical protein
MRVRGIVGFTGVFTSKFEKFFFSSQIRKIHDELYIDMSEQNGKQCEIKQIRKVGNAVMQCKDILK